MTALGVGLGTIVDQTQNAPAASLPGLRRARAARRRGDADRDDRVELAGDGAIKWSRVYHAMIATPLTERDAFVGHQLFVVTRVFTSAAAYLAVIAAFGAVASWWGCSSSRPRS